MIVLHDSVLLTQFADVSCPATDSGPSSSLLRQSYLAHAMATWVCL